MGLFSFFRKNKQESASGQGEFLSRSAGESSAARNSRGAGNARKSGKAGKEDTIDPVLPEKKRARRRLIGAVALVLAVVIVLPMILDSEPHQLGEDIAIQIPSRTGKDADGDKPKQALAEPKEEIVDSASMNAGGERPAIAPGAQAIVPGSVNSTPARQVESAPPVVEKPVEQPVERLVEKPAEKPESKPTLKAEPKAAAKPVPRKDEPKKDIKEAARPKSVDKPDDAARALAILEGKTAGSDKKHATAQASGGGKFVIQVAALATQEKVDELRGKLSSAGIKSYTQKVATQSGERTRIRVGPFASRDEADKMRARINKLGLSATIVPA